jgi:2-polyprenyl-6-methoxyphenol hydroxylase-like FAD-dependent oxidoreductase
MALDCLIAGAGPTGLTAAAELLRHGLSVRLIEKQPTPSLLSRAIGVQARTLEILDDMGAATQLLEAGVRIHGTTLYSGREPIAQVGFDELESRFPFVLAVPQSETERVLAELVERRGGSVERGVELLGFSEEDEAVRAEVRHADGRLERVEASWLLGCDGAHSVARKQLGLGFEGNAFPDAFLLADVILDWELPRDRVAAFFSPDGILACFPLPPEERRWRLVANHAGEGQEAPTLEDFRKLVAARAGFPASLSEATWLASFRINTRQVARYRKGRVFLAGDAAHIHSPVGGQGMNTGIQDAHNLAWKLAHVTRGMSPPSLLDSYHDERHRVGRTLLRGTELATRAGTLRRPVARAIRDQVARYLSSLEVVQRRIARTVAELSISYRGSALVDEHQDGLIHARFSDDAADESPTVAAHRRFAAGPHAGERAPDAWVLDRGQMRPLATLIGDGRHTLLLFDGRARTDDGYRTLSHIVAAVEARFRDRARCFVVAAGAEPVTWDGPLGHILHDPEGEAEDAYGAVAECAYVIRPDLYIGHRCQPASRDRVLAHLDRVLLPAP